MNVPPFSEALKFWFKLGWISFGGPAGQIAIMHQELVDKKKWISEEQFIRALNYCMVLPGPEAQQLATYCGWMMHGARGGIAAGALFILPGFFILGLLSWLYLEFSHLTAVTSLLIGCKAAVVAIIFRAAIKLSKKSIKHWRQALIAVAAFVALQFGKVPFPLIIIAAGLIGFLEPKKEEAFTAKTPSHQVGLSWSLWMAFALAWVLPLLLLPASFQALGLFFTKLALVTFGGAYAVLPYLQQQATQIYGWLTATQMMDGLALGETTPGPLIMIVTFVGFLAGWNQSIGRAWLGAATATYYTFLPSFFFILVGAPYVERWAYLQWLNRVLGSITAAVVGIICTLGFFFAQHLFWINGTLQLFPMVLSLLAFAVLTKWDTNVLWLVLGCGAISWVITSCNVIVG
jgi:chromate transporter